MVGAGQGPGGSSKRAFDPDIVDVAMAATAVAAAAAAAARVVQAHVVKQAPSQPVSQSVSQSWPSLSSPPTPPTTRALAFRLVPGQFPRSQEL